MDQKQEQRGAVKVGMTWGGIGGVVGFLAALIGGSLAGVILSGFVGLSCGKRAAVAEAAAEAGNKSGALSGLIGGSLASPVFILGSAAGAAISARRMSMTEMSEIVSNASGMQISPELAWQLFMLALVFFAFLQALFLILASTAAGAWATRKK